MPPWAEHDIAHARQPRDLTFKGKLGLTIDIVVVVVLLLLLSAATLCKVVQFYSFRIYDWDTGIYANVVWNTLNGNWFYSSVNMRNQLGEHFSPIVLLFVPFFFIAPSALWLLAAQGLAVGATYGLIYLIALKIFEDANVSYAKPLALVFAVWAFFYFPLSRALLSQFHPSTLATPLVAAAILALLHGRDRLLWILVGLLLLSKENAPLAIMGLACYAALMLSRPRLGVALLGTSVVSAGLVMMVVMPLFRSDTWHHYSRLGPLAHLPQKAVYLYTLVKELAFLPLASWRGLICAVPLVALNLAVESTLQFSAKSHYDDFSSVFLLVAAIHGTVALRGVTASMLNGRGIIWAYAFMSILVVALVEPKWNAIHYLRKYWPGDAEWQLHRELASYRDLSPDIGIAADDSLGPYLSFRPRYVGLYRESAKGLDVTLLKLLRPGDKVLITPIRRTDRFPQGERLLEGTAGLVRIHASPVLRVYEVTANTRDEVP
jgi:uncharacterized membrane protein